MENETDVMTENAGNAAPNYAWTVPEVSFGALWHASWASLKGNWGKAIGATLAANAIMLGASMIPVAGKFAQLLLSPLTMGVMLFFLLLVYRENPTVGVIFQPFNRYGHYLWTNIRPNIFIFLWTLLLIIPGIIAAYRYLLTVFIALENSDMSVKDAMTASSELMKGYKFTAFWYGIVVGFVVGVGGIITLGIGLFWLLPWAASFFANFYNAVKNAPRA